MTEAALRDAWLDAFKAELVKLRPHLATIGGKVKHAIALQVFAAAGPTADPADAARTWHEAQSK